MPTLSSPPYLLFWLEKFNENFQVFFPSFLCFVSFLLSFFFFFNKMKVKARNVSGFYLDQL
jgi:hypothetical protein